MQTVAPYFVSTAMTGKPSTNFFVWEPVSYAQAAVATIGVEHYTFGCFPHALQVASY